MFNHIQLSFNCTSSWYLRDIFNNINFIYINTHTYIEYNIYKIIYRLETTFIYIQPFDEYNHFVVIFSNQAL